MTEINFDLPGVNNYLRTNGLRSIKSLWANKSGYTSRYALGNASVSTQGAIELAHSIKRSREGEKEEERFSGSLFITLPYILEGYLRKVFRQPTLQEVADNISEDPLHGAVTALATHEIGHAQRNQMIPNLIMIGGLVLFIGGTTNVCETAWSSLLEDAKIALTGGLFYYTGRILQEYLANNFASKHGSQLAEFITVGSEEL